MQGPSVSWRSIKKCEQAWLQGVVQLRSGNPAAAAESFRSALEHNPLAADAWLGFHAVGQLQDRAVEAMYGQAQDFGALRRKLQTPLSSRFQIGGYVNFRLETDRDLWLARAAKLLDDGLLEQAWNMLSHAVLDCDETRFVCARYAFLKRDWPLLLTFAEGIRNSFLRDESQLYVAAGLIAQGVSHEALNVLRPLPQALGDNAGFLGEVAYLRGRAYEELDRAEEALKHFQTAFRYSPGLGDVAQRAQALTPPTAPAPVPAPVPAQAAPTVREQRGNSSGGTLSDEERSRLLDEAMAELDGMVGLAPVKRQVRSLSAQLRMAAVRRSQGLTAAPAPQHLVFAGPPGTGKTTVARIVGSVFAGLGLLERGHVVEVQRVDLVGQHLGETAIKTSQAIDRALDGVLFIDEAYALSNTGYSGGDAFGKEALQVLLKRAEDDRHRLVVVLAGYPDEIAELLSTNPGLASRFNTRVDFPAYAADDLVLIAESFLEAQGDSLTEEAANALRVSCDLAVTRDLIDRLGNGRFARELVRKAAAARDLRVFDRIGHSGVPSPDEVTTLHLGDVMDAYQELTGSIAPRPAAAPED
ncbi:AAA family ATPase [Streptomyces sp. NBC_01439]|uniref:AAA family ATPase n=1 Tax=Streptomyces sp. NBC_01439 TaxID=2903867 RepID=UPI002E2C9104|nr:AAA family ATPase [Streptomyces sp. NBC_01439]